jgi:hypothetical protein
MKTSLVVIILGIFLLGTCKEKQEDKKDINVLENPKNSVPTQKTDHIEQGFILKYWMKKH